VLEFQRGLLLLDGGVAPGSGLKAREGVGVEALRREGDRVVGESALKALERDVGVLRGMWELLMLLMLLEKAEGRLE